LYKESVDAHPDIPKTVFTKNIDTILLKQIKKVATPFSGDDSSSLFSPVSSLTGGATEATSKGSSIAWRQPLQETLLTKGKQAKAVLKVVSSVELNQRKKISILEAQLNLLGTETRSLKSDTSTQSLTSQLSKKSGKSKVSSSSTQSALSAASAHSRMDKYEMSLEEHKASLNELKAEQTASLHEIMAMLKAMAVSSAPAAPTAPVPLHSDPLWTQSPEATDMSATSLALSGKNLFPPSVGCTALTVLSTPTRNSKKRRNPAASPTKSPQSANLSLQYTEPMDSSGGDPC
jgi:hypothetical protein